MNVNQWTLTLAGAGLISLPGTIVAEEMMAQMETALSSTSISGYVSTSAHWDLGSGNGNPPAYAYNAGKQDGFNLDVVKLSIARPLDEGEWAAGYQVDLLFGPDANALRSQSSGSVSSDFAVMQAYLALRAPLGNGLNFKLGVFDKIIGYESFDAGSNPNYTRSYGYSIEPTTHTGVLMSYDLCEFFTASVGVANTLGPAINGRAGVTGNSRAESYKSYMAGFLITLPEACGPLAGSTIYGGVVNGFQAVPLAVGGTASFNQTSWYVGMTINTPVDGLKVGAAYDYVGIHDGSSSFTSSAYANAAGLYASYQANLKLSFHCRGEYATRSPFAGALAGGPGGANNSSFFPGFLPSKALGVTSTVQYDLWKNVISRLEFRWDHAADGDEHFGGVSPLLGGPGPSKKNAYLVAANFIYQF